MMPDELPPGEYWRHRALERPPDYEDGYWGTIVDPDGNVRVRSDERGKHLQDVSAELVFVNGLAGGRLLDIGCGLGFFLSGVEDNWERHGTELSEFAAERAGQWGTIHVGELSDIAFPDGHFDAVVCHHVIEHVPEPAVFLKEIYRILKSGGALVLGTPDFDSGCARRFGDRYRMLHDPTHVSLFSADSMRRFLRDNGFDIRHVDFPFFQSRYFTEDNLLRLFDTTRVSPPFYGNFMTFYCERLPEASRLLAEAAATLVRVSHGLGDAIVDAATLISSSRARGGQLVLVPNSEDAELLAALFARELNGLVSVPSDVPRNLGKDDVVLLIGGADVPGLLSSDGAKTISLRLADIEETARADITINVSTSAKISRGTAIFAVLGAIVEAVAASTTDQALSMETSLRGSSGATSGGVG